MTRCIAVAAVEHATGFRPSAKYIQSLVILIHSVTRFPGTCYAQQCTVGSLRWLIAISQQRCPRHLSSSLLGLTYDIRNLIWEIHRY